MINKWLKVQGLRRKGTKETGNRRNGEGETQKEGQGDKKLPGEIGFLNLCFAPIK
jgi:hypothetical protein